MHQTASQHQPTGPATQPGEGLANTATSSPAGPDWAVQPVIFAAPTPVETDSSVPLWLVMAAAALATSAALLTALYLFEWVSHG